MKKKLDLKVILVILSIIFGVEVLVALTTPFQLFPFGVQATDSTMSSFVLNTSNSAYGNGFPTAFSFQIETSAEINTGTAFYIMAKKYSQGTFGETGALFSSASVTSSSGGIEGVGSILNDSAFQLHTTAVLGPGVHTFTLDTVLTPALDGCYTFAITTEYPGDGIDYTELSAPFTSGTGSCEDSEDEDSNQNSSEDDSSAAMEIEVVPFGTNIGLEWDAIDSAEQYKIFYEEDQSNFSSGKNTNTPIESEETSAVISDLDENTTYYVLVVAVNSDNSAIAEFDIVPVAIGDSIQSSQPEPLIVVKKATTHSMLTFTWDEPEAVAYVKTYTVQFQKRLKNTEWVKLKNSTLQASKTKLTLKKLKPQTTVRGRWSIQFVTGEETAPSKWAKAKTKNTE